jgi:hypothetical protein
VRWRGSGSCNCGDQLVKSGPRDRILSAARVLALSSFFTLVFYLYLALEDTAFIFYFQNPWISFVSVSVLLGLNSL